MKLQLFVILVFVFNITSVKADPEKGITPAIKVDIIDDTVSSDHFSDEMDVRRPVERTSRYSMPKLKVQEALWKKADISKEIKDYDLLAKDKLYFYLDELELAALMERFPEISEKKMKLLMKLRRGK